MKYSQKSVALILASLLLTSFRSSSMPADKLYDLLTKQVVLIETYNELQQPMVQGLAVALGKTLCTNLMVAMDPQYQDADKEGTDFLSVAFVNTNGNLLLQTTAPISSGSSGGGLFDDDGRLIGITTAQLETGQNLNFARAFKVNEATEFRQLRRGHAIRPQAIREDDWAVGQIMLPPMKLDALNVVRESISQSEFLNSKVIETALVVQDFHKAERSKPFRLDVEGHLAAIDLEEDKDKKQTRIDAIHREFPENLRVKLFSIRELMNRDRTAVRREIAETVEKLPHAPQDASESSLRLRWYVLQLRTYLIVSVTAGRDTAIEAKLREKGW